MDITDEALELALFPYSREYFEMCRDLQIMEISERYLENYDLYISDNGEYQTYFNENSVYYFREDLGDAVGDFFSKAINFMKRIVERTSSFFKNITTKSADVEKKMKSEFSKADGEPPIGTLESVTRKMIQKPHEWNAKEIKDFITNNHSGSVRYWAKLKVSVSDPDIEKLQFAQGVNDKYKAAFKNLLTFIIVREQNPNVKINDLLSEETSPPKFMRSASSKVLVASTGLLGISFVPKILDNIKQRMLDKDEEKLKSEFEQIEKTIVDLKDEQARLQVQISQTNPMDQGTIQTLQMDINTLEHSIKAAEEGKKKAEERKKSIRSQRMGSKITSTFNSILFKILSLLGATVAAAMFCITKVSNLLGKAVSYLSNSIRSVLVGGSP